ncbi:MAG: hypothetical protein Q9177_004375 [Variospora cf. flavescens]
MDTLLTADLAANAPRFRRKSSTYVDAIHDLPAREELAPAQLYSTESGDYRRKNLRPGEGIPDDYFFVNVVDETRRDLVVDGRVDSVHRVGLHRRTNNRGKCPECKDLISRCENKIRIAQKPPLTDCSTSAGHRKMQ